MLHCRACGLPDPEDKCCSIREDYTLRPCPCCLYYVGKSERRHHPACPTTDPGLSPRQQREAAFNAAYFTGPPAHLTLAPTQLQPVQ